MNLSPLPNLGLRPLLVAIGLRFFTLGDGFLPLVMTFVVETKFLPNPS